MIIIKIINPIHYCCNLKNLALEIIDIIIFKFGLLNLDNVVFAYSNVSKRCRQNDSVDPN